MPKAKRKKRSSRKGKARKGWTLRGFLLLWAFLLLAGVIVFFIFQAHEENISLKGLKDYFTKKMTSSPKKREISLFFADSQAHYLVKERRKVYAKGSIAEQARDLIKALISGSKKGMVPTLPPGTLTTPISRSWIQTPESGRWSIGEAPTAATSPADTLLLCESILFLSPPST